MSKIKKIPPLSTKEIWYLASPYTTDNPYVRHLRFLRVTDIAGRLIEQGYFLFCPITQSHSIVTHSPLIGTSWEYWKDFDLEMLNRVDGLLVYTLPGWKASVGVQAEIFEAKRLGIPIQYVDANAKVTTKPAKFFDEAFGR